MDTPAILQFIDGLITEKHGHDLDPQARASYRSAMTAKLNKWILLKTMELLGRTNPDSLTEFQQLVSTNPSPDAVRQFLAPRIPNETEFLTKTLLEFRATYLGPDAVQSPT